MVNLGNLNLEPESFDVILSIDSIFFGQDLKTTLERLKSLLDSDGQMAINAPSHLRGALLGFEAFFPIENGKMICGGRQTIYFVELDGPQERSYIIQIMGN